MQGILRHTARRRGYDGWAVKVDGARVPFRASVSTTREEARQWKRQMEGQLGLPSRLRVVKVRIKVDALDRPVSCR